jgi:hypothetical protein
VEGVLEELELVEVEDEEMAPWVHQQEDAQAGKPSALQAPMTVAAPYQAHSQEGQQIHGWQQL